MANEFNQIGLTSLNGGEILEVSTGPLTGGYPIQQNNMFVTSNALRNSQANTIVTSTAAAVVTTCTINNGIVMWSSTVPTTWQVILPAGAGDGQVMEVGTDTTLTTRVTVSAATGSTMNTTFNNQTISGSTSVQFFYNAAATKWYQLR